MFLKTILLFLLCSISFHTTLAQETPNWLNGEWTGLVAWEHDTTDYKISFSFNESQNKYQVYYPHLHCEFSMEADSLNQNFARFTIPKHVDETKPCLQFGFSIKLHKIQDSEVLHVQYKWKDQLWLGQVQRKR